MDMAPLVLLHGYPFNHTMWDKVSARLCDLISPDLRAFGKTPPGDHEPSVDWMAKDINDLLERKGIESAIIAGFSMGGYVALAFAERYPARLSGLGLINSHPYADTAEARAGRRAMIAKVRQEGPRAAADAAIPKLFSSTKSGDEALTRYAVQAAEQAGTEGICWALEAMARRPDRSALLESLRIPILLLHSTEDQFIPVTLAHQLAERLPQALSIEVSGAGHCSPLEAPEIVAKALSELVKRAAVHSA